MAYANPWERLTEAVLRYADSSDDDREFVKNKDNLRKSAIIYGYQVLAGKDRNVRVYVQQRTKAVERVYIVRRPRIARAPLQQLGLWPARSR